MVMPTFVQVHGRLIESDGESQGVSDAYYWGSEKSYLEEKGQSRRHLPPLISPQWCRAYSLGITGLPSGTLSKKYLSSIFRLVHSRVEMDMLVANFVVALRLWAEMRWLLNDPN